MPSTPLVPARDHAPVADQSGGRLMLVTGHHQSERQRRPTAIQREVLKLLAMGDTDMAIARKLAMSLRTTRRRVAELKQQLDVTSRVEVALAAARRGWLEPE